ncbi:MAG: hypothetical protein K8H88_26445, partial [Sandaracinaceae bacterium]|nr:hypothetical protein [Sandaracinaceae bacterium]
MTPAHGASTDDVVAWLLGDGHLSCVDEDGRPIGEQGSPLYASLPQDERVRAFGDARDASGLSCNHTALLQIRAAWPAILATHAALENDRPSTHQRILRRTLSATSLAALASLRAPGVPIGRELAAFYKVSIGFSELCAGLLLEGAIDADDRPVPDERLFAWLDERKLLVGQRQVCAGTRAQIRRMWS